MNNNLYKILIDYIENNKEKNNIDYFETIEHLKELINEIKKEYEEIGGQ